MGWRVTCHEGGSVTRVAVYLAHDVDVEEGVGHHESAHDLAHDAQAEAQHAHADRQDGQDRQARQGTERGRSQRW